MASFDTFQQLAAHPEWIAPRSANRVFLGEPGAPEATKTTVEPGNVFSPGMKTFGVTWWLRFPEGDEFFATETAPLEALTWRYEDGYLPVLNCQTQVEGLTAQHVLFQDGTWREQNEAVCGQLTLTNTEAEPRTVEVFIALRSLGPAGGPVRSLSVGNEGHSFWLVDRDLPLLAFDHAPTSIGCDVGDPSPLARGGFVPLSGVAHDANGWCFGLARYDMVLAAGESWTVAFDCPQQTYGNLEGDLPGRATPNPATFDERRDAHLARWREIFGQIELNVPDSAFREAFFAGLQHMMTAVVGDQARIAPLAYPLPWLRDSVFIIRSFDLAGQHDMARAAAEYCARNDFFGGFGAEGDAPGEGIWALTQHYRVTRDLDWLRSVYPAIRRKCDWLFKMRRAEEPIQLVTDTPTLSFTHAERAAGVICVATKDGLIQGTMDHGISYSLGWINQWALCGLREAAYVARELGEENDAARFTIEANELGMALRTHAENSPEFFHYERTVNSLLWPTGAWSDAVPQTKAGFNSWWDAHRIKDGAYQPEPYWLYFEFAQAHNALLMGQRNPVWRVLDYRMANQDVPGLYGWREGADGVGTDNAIYGVTLINQLRGCQTFDDITPHGWSQAEMWLLQRAVLVDEWNDGLILFAGVPDKWLTPGAVIAFDNFPTNVGLISARLQVSDDGKSALVLVTGPATIYRLRLPNSDEIKLTNSGTIQVNLR